MPMAAETRFWTTVAGRKGFAAGLVGPWVIMGLYVVFRLQVGSTEDSDITAAPAVSEWWRLLWGSGLFGPLLSLAVLPNLALFWWNLYRQSEEGAGGVLVATFVYALVVVAVKWFF